MPGPYLGITSLGIASCESYSIFIEIADIGFYPPVHDSVDNYLDLDIPRKVLGPTHKLWNSERVEPQKRRHFRVSSLRLTSENGGNIQTYKDGLQVPQGASWGFPGSIRLP